MLSTHLLTCFGWSGISRREVRGLDVRGLDVRWLDVRGLDVRGLDVRGLDDRGLDVRGLDVKACWMSGVDGLDIWVRAVELVLRESFVKMLSCKIGLIIVL